MSRWVLALFLALPLLGEGWSVVVSNQCCQQCEGRVAMIYLKKQVRIGSCRAVPLNLPLGGPGRERFMKKVVKMDLDAWNLYWSEMHFKGVDAPLVLHSPEAVARFVTAVPGAVGFVPSGLVDDAMTVLEAFQ